ncbi:MAG: hypothetical protein UT24_C0016G0037 [Candidatus Woesebacteria bacterium GW2011_GWB1_39_12]|uniref:Uncharacterized protein n=1 Tax=Candidatus Woesebacteria bacterium GW2011_GWB1_39_12 TaxID=1618574 RepID=A0A0G0MAF1_9BACT|nr:MAG: hypothetical protein UT24_C0016G0037 [Candidatus Woesebacteria bacterium GW2011_GWB1_39_12]
MKLSKKELKEVRECKYCDGVAMHRTECWLKSFQMIPTDLPDLTPIRKLKVTKLKILK